MIALGYSSFVAIALPALGYDALCTYALLGILGALGLAGLGSYALLRKVVVSRLRATIGPEKPEIPLMELLQAFHVLLIIAASIAEGFALFSLVVYFVTGHFAGLVGAAVGALVLIGLYPSESRFRRFEAAVGGAPV